MSIIEQIVNGILLGSSYSLIAIGFSVIFGILRLFNMAHGEVLMVSSFMGTFLLLLLQGESFIFLTLALLTAICAGAILSILVEGIAFRPLRKAPEFSPLIATLGIAIFLEDFFFILTKKLRLFKATITTFPNPLDLAGFTIGGVYIRSVYLVSFLVALILMITIHVIVQKTKTGRGMRALTEHPTGARLMGVKVDSTIRLTFMLAGGLAGAAGMLLAIVNSAFDVKLGGMATLIGLVVMILGGMGSIIGAMVGGLVFGIIQTTSSYFWETSYRDIVAFGLLFLILIFKPEGLFGTRQ